MRPSDATGGERLSHGEWAASERERRAARRARYEADTARLKELGGRRRSEAEDGEFSDIFLRDPSRSREYFEGRIWEKPCGPALA